MNSNNRSHCSKEKAMTRGTNTYVVAMLMVSALFFNPATAFAQEPDLVPLTPVATATATVSDAVEDVGDILHTKPFADAMSYYFLTSEAMDAASRLDKRQEQSLTFVAVKKLICDKSRGNKNYSKRACLGLDYVRDILDWDDGLDRSMAQSRLVRFKLDERFKAHIEPFCKEAPEPLKVAQETVKRKYSDLQMARATLSSDDDLSSLLDEEEALRVAETALKDEADKYQPDCDGNDMKYHTALKKAVADLPEEDTLLAKVYLEKADSADVNPLKRLKLDWLVLSLLPEEHQVAITGHQPGGSGLPQVTLASLAGSDVRLTLDDGSTLTGILTEREGKYFVSTDNGDVEVDPSKVTGHAIVIRESGGDLVVQVSEVYTSFGSPWISRPDGWAPRVMLNGQFSAATGSYTALGKSSKVYSQSHAVLVEAYYDGGFWLLKDGLSLMWGFGVFGGWKQTTFRDVALDGLSDAKSYDSFIFGMTGRAGLNILDWVSVYGLGRGYANPWGGELGGGIELSSKFRLRAEVTYGVDFYNHKVGPPLKRQNMNISSPRFTIGVGTMF